MVFTRFIGTLVALIVVFLATGPAFAANSQPQYAATVDYTTRTITFHRTGEVFNVAIPRAPGMRRRGIARVTSIVKDPVWTPTSRIRRIMASRGIKLRQSYRPYREDKNNPLGPWIIHLTFDKRDTLRGLHGTKDPLSIGKAATMGCFRVYNEAIEYIVRSGLIRRGDNILFR